MDKQWTERGTKTFHSKKSLLYTIMNNTDKYPKSHKKVVNKHIIYKTHMMKGIRPKLTL